MSKSSSSSSSSSVNSSSLRRRRQGVIPDSSSSPSSRTSPSSRSKSMGSMDIEMFPRRCSRAFINRTKKASFQEWAKKLKIDISYYDEDDKLIWLTKPELCSVIRAQFYLKGNKKPTKKAKPTSPSRKKPRSRGPMKAAHKS